MTKMTVLNREQATAVQTAIVQKPCAHVHMKIDAHVHMKIDAHVHIFILML
jgi:hypothetical protein